MRGPEAVFKIGFHLLQIAAAEPTGGKSADYMFIWTSVLEGAKGLGEDFDFFYFVDPAILARLANFEFKGHQNLKVPSACAQI